MVTALVAGLALAIGACGEESGSGTVTLNFWAYNEPGGTFRAAAERCSAASNGRYRINFNALGNDPNTQRQALVRRLAAGDSSIDIMSMDVIWTAEFAEAGWILPFPDDVAAQVKEGTLQGPLDTATYKGKLYGAPANSNTQLLWYRKDLVQTPPKTWSEMIDMAVKMPKAGRIEIQGDAVRGLHGVVQLAASQSAGGQILSVARQGRRCRRARRRRRWASSQKLAQRRRRADPSLSATTRGPEPARVRDGRRRVPGELPVHLSERHGTTSRRSSRTSRGRRIQAWRPASRRRAPIGGFNWGVGGNTKHPAEAFAAAACMRNEQNQRDFALQGRPAADAASALRRPVVQEGVPVRRSRSAGSWPSAAVRPQTPVYSDVSQAIFTTLHPPSSVKPGGVEGAARQGPEGASGGGPAVSETHDDRRPRRPRRSGARRKARQRSRAGRSAGWAGCCARRRRS